MIHESEWKTIEEGLKQRAHLLDLILKDLYGPQSLIKNAIIPAELVFDNSGFLLPCFDIRQKHDKQLLNYAEEHQDNALKSEILNLERVKFQKNEKFLSRVLYYQNLK